MLHRKFGIAAFATLFAIIGHAQPVKESPAPVFDVVSVKPSGTNQLVSDGPGPAVRLHARFSVFQGAGDLRFDAKANHSGGVFRQGFPDCRAELDWRQYLRYCRRHARWNHERDGHADAPCDVGGEIWASVSS